MARARKASIERYVARSGMLMVLPSAAVIAVFTLFPILQSAAMSFYNWNILKNIQKFVGFDNFLKAFQDERFLNALANTFIYTVSYVPLLVVMALVLAVFLSYAFWGSGFFRSLFFLPAITSMAIIAIVFRFILDGDIGLVSLWLNQLGIPVKDFLRMPETAMGSIVFTGLWRWLGFNMVIVLAGLNSIPETLYEAAEIDGAGKVRQFFRVTIPLLIPTLAFIVITNLINAFQVFDQIYVMTKGGPMFSTEVSVYYIFYQGFTVFSMGYASSLAFILFVLIFLVTLVQLRWFRRSEREDGLA